MNKGDKESGNTSDIFNDENVPLDFDLLSSLAVSLLYADPKKCGIIKPFRLKTILNYCERKSNVSSNEFRLMDAALAYFTLCVYFSLQTSYDPDIVLTFYSFLETILVESLIIEQNEIEKSLISGNILTVLHRDEEINTEYKLEVFSTCLETVRCMLRDVLNMARSMQRFKHMKPEEKKAAIPVHIECLRPYCFYFAAQLALSHITAVMHSCGNLLALPGSIETNICCLLTQAKNESKHDRAETPVSRSRSRKQKKDDGTANYDLPRCINQARSLAIFMAHYVFTQAMIEQTLVTRNRMIKHLVHPGIKFTQFRVSNFRQLLGTQLQTVGKVNADDAKGIINAQKLLPHQSDFFIASHYRSNLKLIDPREARSEDGFDDTISYSFTMLEEGNEASDGTREKQLHCWSLRKSFRPLFLLLDACQRNNTFRSCFEDIYAPPLLTSIYDNHNLATSKVIKNMNPTACARFLEGYYFHHFSDGSLPRQYDPLDELYWICQHIIEYLQKMATLGEGFVPTLLQETQILKKKLKHEVIKQPSSISKLSLSATIPSSSSTAKHPTSSSSKKSKNLATLLANAKEEAKLESKLHAIEAKMNGLELSSKAKDAMDEHMELFATETEGSSSSNSTTIEVDCSFVPSIIWHCPAKVFKIAAPTVMVQNDFEENPLGNLPPKTAMVAYAKQLEDYKIAKIEQEINFKQYLEDQQDAIVAKNRAMKGTMLRNMRERMKEDITSKNALKIQWEDERRKLVIAKQQQLQREVKEKEEAQIREEYRIRQIKEMKKAMDEKEARDHSLMLERQKMIISKIVDQTEAKEIVRRNTEEARMKYLEERRRRIEQRQFEEELKQKEMDDVKHQQLKESVDRMQGRVRMGTFKWVDGVYGYYDNVRKEPKEYVQYDNEEGKPYYYDPILKTFQYREPTDAPIRHVTEYERAQYDAMYGEGAYDAHKADIAFKDAVNRDGGYYDDTGKWIKVNGYYDANYNWVDHEGYVDENGKYRKFAKVQGDLSFMV